MNKKSGKNAKSPFEHIVRQNVQFNNNKRQASATVGGEAAKPLLEVLQPGPLLLSKPLGNFSSKRKTKFSRQNRRENSTNEENERQNPVEPLRSINDLREPSAEHLNALRSTFEEILKTNLVSETIVDQQFSIWLKLRQMIVENRPACQIRCYGSYIFKCCLNKKSYVDVDIQFKEALAHDPLKEILELVLKSDLVKEAAIDSERKPSCVNVIIKEPNMGIRITSGYLRGFYLSKLIQIYTKIDGRLLKLLRLFRYFSKVCNIDQVEIGMLHPMTYHIMFVYFLQQIEPPVLPSLHELIFGVDHVPLTLNDNQYGEFFRLAEQISSTWKSTNSTPYEILFLQFFSFYVKTFNSKQFVVSIQTRMPVVKLEKNWQSRRLLVEDPTDIKRGLCQTMSSTRSVDYFREIFNCALNYFGREQKKSTKTSKQNDGNDDDFVEIVVEDEKSTNEMKNSLHNSYKLFYRKFPPSVAKDSGIKQNRIREYYKNLFDEKTDPMPKALLQIDSSSDNFDDFIEEEEIRQALQNDEEENFETMDENDEIDEEISSPIDQSETTSNVKTEEIQVEREISETKPNDFFYDFKPENFNAEQVRIERIFIVSRKIQMISVDFFIS